jgi:hypothetical protein
MGLSGYGPSATHCDTLFSEAFPDAYLGVHVLFLVTFSIITLLYAWRLLLCVVDTQRMPAALSFISDYLQDERYKRKLKPNKLKPGTMELKTNVYDFCNIFMFVTSCLQVVLSCDVEGWSNMIPYKVHVTLGLVSQNIAIMTGIPITVHWMNLIHVWSNPFKK